jgi:hypothetical protein
MDLALAEEAGVACAHLQRRAPGHRVDDLDERAQDGTVEDVDRAHDGHAERERQDDEAESESAAAEEEESKGRAIGDHRGRLVPAAACACTRA